MLMLVRSMGLARARFHYLTLEIVLGLTPYEQAKKRTDSPSAFLPDLGNLVRAEIGFRPSHPGTSCSFSSLSCPGLDQFTFKLGEAAQHREHRPTRGGGGVAHGSARDLKRHPLSAMALMMVSRSIVERPNLSSRVTTRYYQGPSPSGGSAIRGDHSEHLMPSRCKFSHSQPSPVPLIENRGFGRTWTPWSSRFSWNLFDTDL